MSQTHAGLAHQFDDLHQQKEADTLGMWLFLGTEIMLFGGLFTCYTMYREAFFHAFSEASHDLYVSLGTINTAVLLTSSLLMAMAVYSAHKGRPKSIVRYLLATIFLGLVFLIIKGTEYTLEWHDHVVPFFGNWIDKPGLGEENQPMKLFFIFYFFMTGLHALHMIAGVTLLALIARQAHRGKYSSDYYNPVEIAGLYWHFVDIVWVFLLPTLYLVNPK